MSKTETRIAKLEQARPSSNGPMCADDFAAWARSLSQDARATWQAQAGRELAAWQQQREQA